MSEENNPPANEPSGDESTQAKTPSPGAELRLKRKADKLQSQLESTSAELEELRAYKLEIEEAQSRRDKDWAKLEERYKGDLKKAKDERDGLLAQIDKRNQEDRRNGFVAKLASKSGVNAAVVKGLLLQVDGIESAPEEVTDDSLQEALAAIKELSPETFQVTPRGGSRGAPGTSSDPNLSKGARVAQARNERNGSGNPRWRELPGLKQ